MAVDPQIRRIASRANLDLAWLRLRTSTERTYRDYFRDLYRAYGLAADSHLDALRAALLDGYYEPASTTKLFFPKSSGLQRVYTLLSVDDQIAYQAIANLIADKLYRKTRDRHLRSVFGHLYAGPGSRYFYRDWRKSYTSFAGAMRRAFKEGHSYTASFDLTACYDSIDHDVLRHFLQELGVSQEVSALLCKMLRRWTDASSKNPIYHGHGIPQGPLPSGLLAEVVLAHFDSTSRKKGLRYFRYVDDIRLFAKFEITLRQELIGLDIKSKEVGLFPQSAKISIHRVTNIEDEMKGISRPAGSFGAFIVVDQVKLKRALVALSPRFRVANSTQFKFDLGTAAPDTALVLRLLAILERDPAFYDPVCRYVARCPRLSRKASRRLLDVLRSHDLYPGFAAGLLRSARENLHRDVRPRLFSYCQSRLKGRRSSRSAEVRGAAAAVLLWHRQLSWRGSRDVIGWRASSWMRAWVLQYLQPDHIGIPSYEALLHDALRDESTDPALMAAELTVTHRLAVARPLRTVNPAAQRTFYAVGKIGKVQRGPCLIRANMTKTLTPKIRPVVWEKILDAKTYRRMVTRSVVWASYATTDATAWVVLTDVIDDILLDALHRHDTRLGSYTLGRIGSVLQPTSRLAQHYPKLYTIVERVHMLRLEADLAHPVTRATNAATRRILFRDMRKLLKPLEAGYLELWANW